MPSHEHMRDVMLRYAALLSARDVDGIVALFSPDAALEDPVGTEPKRGHEAIRAFYSDGFIQTDNTMTMAPDGAVRVAGNEAACAMLVRCRLGDKSYLIETMDTMAFDGDGRITLLRAHVGPLNFHPQDA